MRLQNRDGSKLDQLGSLRGLYNNYINIHMSITSTPTTLNLKELIATGRIGKIISSEVRAAGWIIGNGNGNTVPEEMENFTERSFGGNFVTIGFAHGQLSLFWAKLP